MEEGNTQKEIWHTGQHLAVASNLQIRFVGGEAVWACIERTI